MNDARGAVQELAEICEVRPVGAYQQFTLRAPGIAAGFRPGHFVAVAVGGPASAMMLRRAFALYGAGADGTISFVVAEHGAGTRWLSGCRAGDRLDVVGPMGQPFRRPAEPVPAVLVGGGYGTAPLIALAADLRAHGSTVEFLLAAATLDRLFARTEAEGVADHVIVTTDDGSAGRRGRVTDGLAEAIERSQARVVYACGPMPMLRAAGEVAAAHGIPAQVAVEESMACGIGVCMTCVLPVRGEDGRSRFVRSCVDGPVFAADRVRWADVGRLPDDLVGADAMGGH
jgi:dihydroorotate dehydrogenase electron transfer subunit